MKLSDPAKYDPARPPTLPQKKKKLQAVTGRGGERGAATTNWRTVLYSRGTFGADLTNRAACRFVSLFSNPDSQQQDGNSVRRHAENATVNSVCAYNEGACCLGTCCWRYPGVGFRPCVACSHQGSSGSLNEKCYHGLLRYRGILLLKDRSQLPAPPPPSPRPDPAPAITNHGFSLPLTEYILVARSRLVCRWDN